MDTPKDETLVDVVARKDDGDGWREYLPMADWLTVGQFGDAVLKEMETWRAGPLTGEPMESVEVCRKLDKAYYVWLACAVRLLRPRNILELGSLRGFSAIAMYSEKQPSATLTMVDKDFSHLHIPDVMRSDPTVRFVEGNDLDISIFGDSPLKDVDFLFMDTEHYRAHVEPEWKLYRQFLVPGALVAVDDIIAHDLPRWWNNLPYKTAIEFRDGHSTGFGYWFYEVV